MEKNETTQAAQKTPESAASHSAALPVNSKLMQANFSLPKFILLSLITFGIYGIYTFAKMGNCLDLAASKYDGKKTMSFWLVFFLVGPITLEIGTLVWFHKFSGRLGRELARRQLPVSFSSGTFWLFNVLGAIVLVGPFIYIYKLSKAMNALVEDYQEVG